MKEILVLGAGQSAPFLIARLLELAPVHDWRITVGDLDKDLADSRVAGHERGNSIRFDINDSAQRDEWIGRSDVVINMLAPRFLDRVAYDCVERGTNMLSVSYRTRAIREMDSDARRKGILLLCELGLDPGIDHMSAISLIERVRADGGKITGFQSYGSGIPAPENDPKPLRYAITWNPRNVVMSSETGAQYMESGLVKCVPWHHVFHHTWHVDVEGAGLLEAYPNRDSLSYMQSFGLSDVRTMIRGTLRYPGWCETWARIVELGLPNEHLRIPDLQDRSYAEVTEMFLPLTIDSSDDPEDVEQRFARFLRISPTGRIMENLRWLGLFSEDKVECEGDTAASMLVGLLEKRMPLGAGERDMVILLHRLDVHYDDGRDPERITSTLVHRGDAGGFTAMARSVGMPVVIATRLLLTGEIDLQGSHIPLQPEIYVPGLRDLAAEGLEFTETTRPL